MQVVMKAAVKKLAAAATIVVICLIAVTGCGNKTKQQGRNDLPDDFPVSAVPLLEGTVQQAEGKSPTWTVTIAVSAQGRVGVIPTGVMVASTKADYVRLAAYKLKDSGYQEETRNDNGIDLQVTLVAEKSSKRYTVLVGTSVTSPGVNLVTYQITTS